MDSSFVEHILGNGALQRLHHSEKRNISQLQSVRGIVLPYLLLPLMSHCVLPTALRCITASLKGFLNFSKYPLSLSGIMGTSGKTEHTGHLYNPLAAPNDLGRFKFSCLTIPLETVQHDMRIAVQTVSHTTDIFCRQR